MNVVPSTYRAKKLAIVIGSDASRRVDNMLQRQNLNGQTASRRDFSVGSIGCLGTSLPMHGNVCFFTGVPINGPRVLDITNANAAKQLFREYDGAFSGIFLDAEQRKLVIATDCLGMQPLYMRHAGGELILVSETKAMHGEPDLAAWGAFLSVGHPIGQRSLMRDLVRVPPACILTYDFDQDRLDIHQYWQWPEPSEAWRKYNFLSSLKNDVKGYAALGNPGTVLLSGGFDSRLLFFLLEKTGVRANTLIVAHEDEHSDADGRLAEALTALKGVQSLKVYPPKDFYSSSEYLEYLRASDAGYPSLDLFIAKIASQINAAAVWDGLVPGFVFMPLHQPEGGFDAYLRQEIRGVDSPIWHAAKTVFKSEIVEAMQDGFASDLRDELSRLPRDSYGLGRFVIENRSRNRTSMNPLKVYANHADAYVPGLSKDFMSHAAVIPFEKKRNALFYRQLFSILDKQALSLPFISGGKLIEGTRFSPVYYRESLRNAFNTQRMLRPRLFLGKRQIASNRSTFLGSHLFDDSSGWLNPQAQDRMTYVSNENYLSWKLLFQWKAWQGLHAGRLEQTVDGNWNSNLANGPSQ